MPAIPNFPDDLSDQHHHWHNPSAHPDAGPGRVHPAGTLGGGLEFLTFHRNFVAQFRSWYDTETFTVAPFDDPAVKAQLVAPWYAVPAELQKTEYGWLEFADDAARLDSGSPDFASADQLGTYIELGIHNNFLHGAAAAEYGEPVLASLHSPHITQFYGIHGLVDRWWANWQRSHKIRIKEVVEIDLKQIRKDVNVDVDLKQLVRDTIHIDPHKRVDDVKSMGLEGPDDLFDSIDPVVLEAISARLNRLERRAFPGKAFIEGDRRPDLGKVTGEGGN
jgi:hypothetical protein